MSSKNVEDIYRLSPLQQAMLYHCLAEPGTGVEQLCLKPEGDLNRSAFRRAWERTLARHAILRTSFHWQKIEQPVQVVRRQVELPWAEEDWHELAAREQEERLAALLAADRGQVPDLGAPPAMRLRLIRFGDRDWRFLWSFHRLLLDGDSAARVLGEVLALYQALCRGEDPAPAPAPPYREHFLRLQEQDTAAAERFWRRELAGLDAPTPLGLEPGRGGGRRRLPLPASAELATFAERRRLHPETLLYGAWALLLSRYGEAQDVVFGILVSQRPADEIVGLLVNLLPLRVRVRPQTMLLPWLREIDARRRQVLELAHLPLAQIRQWCSVPSSRPLFESMIGPAPPPAGALNVRQLQTRQPLPCPLSLSARFDAAAELSVQYDGSFDGGAVDRLLASLRSLLGAMAADPTQELGQLPLLSPVERHQVATEWNDTAAPASERCVHELFEAQVRRSPAAPAVGAGPVRWSYEELNRRANHLAHRLRELGVGPEKPVAIFVDRSPTMIACLFAVLKAGGFYVPLDPADPRGRLAQMLDDLRPPVLLTQTALLPLLPDCSATVLEPDEQPDPAGGSVADPIPRARPDNLAYAIYTSGSTGRPKGVQVPHRGLVNLLEAMRREPGMTSDDVLLAVTTFSFDMAWPELTLPLCAGGRIELAGREECLDATALCRRLEECGATALQATPTTWGMLLRAGWQGDPRLTAMTGGEALGADLAAALTARCASLWDLYGPTETTVNIVVRRLDAETDAGSIGRPTANNRAFVVDRRQLQLPPGIAGELLLGGVGLTRGYWGMPAATAARFVPDGLSGESGTRLYRTGDLARYRGDGEIQYLGRIDHQVKMRGFRIELGEIEVALRRHPAVRAVAVTERGGRLVAYLVAEPSPAVDELRRFLQETLPDYMVPALYVPMAELPRTATGKVDRGALPEPSAGAAPELTTPWTAPGDEAERTIAAIWKELLEVDRVGAGDNFFDLGGHSLLLGPLLGRLRREFPEAAPTMIDLFRNPTVRSLAQRLAPAPVPAAVDQERPGRPEPAERPVQPERTAAATAIAVIGMAGRFPGAGNVGELWRNLCDGVEGISFFSDDEMLAAGAPRGWLADPSRVKARGVLAGAFLFDADFFGFTDADAEITDPQHRVFLETAWEALEDAGYDPGRHQGAIGVWAGVSYSTYWMYHLLGRPGHSGPVAQLGIPLANDKDYLAPRVSYKLNLRGPSVTVQTACSSSLVAVHHACQALLSEECDLALAGGVSISTAQEFGYPYQEGGILSPDGHCRAFDAGARGTVPGSGAGIVVLKRLADALADGDAVDAVIRGSAVNNDGSLKVGFTAPGVDGQARVIAAALARAEVDPASVTLIEAHGTGTELGDPIEIAALTEVFGAGAGRRSCAVGSIKTNLGHLDAAAGVAGLIKAALALRHRRLPPSLHYERPNPEIDFDRGPFYVNSRLAPWTHGDAPRRAGVSSFGLGGTNAHVVLEEAPPAPPAGESRDWQLLAISARSAAALDAATHRLADHLAAHPELDLSAVAYSLRVGRRDFAHRRCLVCRDPDDAVAALRAGDPERLLTTVTEDSAPRPVAFLFPGQGAQYPGMGRELYATEPAFREVVDDCAGQLVPHLGLDLREVLHAADEHEQAAAERLEQTALAQPALFVVEYALARLFLSWGVKPRAMIGHSIGEYVAACLAGVFSLPAALELVAARGRLMQSLPAGAMLAVSQPAAQLEPRLGSELAAAAINEPGRCIISGPVPAIEALARRLGDERVACRRLRTSHAFHSPMMDPILDEFRRQVRRAEPGPPRTPFVSDLTGTWITAAAAADPDYWARHLRHTVRLDQGLATLLEPDPAPILLELGPGRTLSTAAGARPEPVTAVGTLPGARDGGADAAAVLTALGRLRMAGAVIDQPSFDARENRRRVSLPTYPFERREFRVEPIWSRTEQQEAPAVTAPAVTAAPVAPAAPVVSRRSRLLAQLRELYGSVTGRPDGMPEDVPFVELGMDSLHLLQASHLIEQNFGVRVPFRLLLMEITTLAALAEHLDATLPPEPEPEPIPQPTPEPALAPTSLPAPAAGGGLEALMRQQLEVIAEQSQNMTRIIAEQSQAFSQVISQQLTLLGAAPPATVPAPAVAAPAVPVRAKAVESGKIAPAAYVPYRPPQVASGELTARRQQHLDALIARLDRRCRQSKALAQEQRPVLADGRASAGFRLAVKELLYPIFFARGQGSRVWDVDGNEYVDLTMGFGTLLFGHSPPFILTALQEQSGHGLGIGLESPLAGRAARLLCELTGCERAAFVNSGSEAVITAVRLARTRTGRSKIAVFEGGYHGFQDEALVSAVADGAGGLRSMIMVPGIPPQVADNVMVLEYCSERSLEILRAAAGELAAVLVEPQQSRRAGGFDPGEFLRRLREITEQAGTALILDEVITGFRIHPGGAQAVYGVRADLVTYGKGIGAGVPAAAVAGRAEYLDGLDGGSWNYGDDSYPQAESTYVAGTYFKHPLIMAAVWAVLDHFKTAGAALQQGMTERAERLATAVNDLFEQEQVPIRMLQWGSICNLLFAPEVKHPAVFYGHLLDNGVYVREKRPIFLSAEHGDEDQERVLAALRATIAAMREGDFLPAGGERPDSERRVPATTAQQELFTLAQLGEDASRAYNEGLVLRWRGALEVELLRRSVQQVVDRHEALRATFSRDGEQLRIAAEVPVGIAVEDLARAERSVVDRRLAAAVDETFDFFAGPLFRFRLLRCGNDEHLLAATFHHAVVDGLSTDVLLQEIIASYGAAVRGESIRLPDPQPFGAFVCRQRQWQQGPEMAAAEAYWMAELAGSVPVLELPIDRPRPPWRSHAGRWRQLEMAGPDYQALRRTATRTGATLFATLLAAFQAFLHRLTGQRDLIAGTATAGQAEMGRQPLVGHCVNVLPMRSRIAGDPTFPEFQAGVRSRLAESYEHQHYPFHQLVHKLNLAPDPSRLPLVAALINFESAGGEATIRIGAISIEVVPNRPRSAKFELSLDVTAFDERMQIHCNYNSDLFDHTTVGRWLRGFRNLTAGIGRRPEQSLRQLPLLDAAERQQLLEWNDTELRRPATCLDRLFAEQVRRGPGMPALVFAGRQLSYAELAARADRLAGWLQDRGSGPNTLVGVCMERSLELVVAIYGILRAGAAYVPLDPDHPRERLAFLIADADPPVVLTQEHLASRLPASSAAVVCLDARWPEIDRHRPTRPLAAAAPGDLAYVIHTSGSTGRPKGVGVSHRAICNLLAWMQRTYGLEAGDRVLQKTPMSFDVSVWEFFWPLACGARLVLARPGEHRDPAALIALIRAQEITILHFVPSMLRAFLEQPEAASCTTVRRVTCGGEALPRELEQRFFATLPEARLHHLYGPAEAAVDVTLWSCRRGDSRSSVPIGRAIDNVRILLLDAGMVPVPPGVKGELHVGGVALARGYWRRPGLTAASFVPDPFGRRRGERLYKTGDLARCGADGVVEFLGRSDHQVKIRGMRVELGEIETVLGRHPEVRETAVQAVPDAAGGNRLVAWVVPRRPGEMAKGELISWLEAELPAYMVPPAFVEIDELPLTRTGKLDRRRLPAPEPTDDDEQFVAPRTPVEAKLAKIWRQVLDLERVGVNDSFFRLGGHSLLGTRLMLRIREQLGRELPLRALFEAPTVAGLARRIATAARSEMPPLLPRPPGDPLSLSFAQERMLFLDRLNPGSGVYNIPSAWKLIGPLDQTALRHALGTIADRHEVLRTCFPTLADQPVQRITPRPERPLAIVDLTVLRAAEREPELKRLAVEEARRPFDLARGPLLRSTLVKLAAEESGLLITMHHIVSDAWSLGIFFGELTALYAAFCRRRPAPLPPLGIQYADFAAWQHRWLTGAVIEEHLAFWTRRLEGVLPLDLPGDRPRPVVQRLRGANVNLRLSATLSDGIRRLGQAHGATLYMTLLAAFQTLLGRWAGQTDFVVGTPIANRGRIELEGLIGFFINTLTMRANLAGDPTFATLLARTADESLDAYHYQDLPFEKLVEHLDPQRDLSRNPIFQVTFVLQNAPMPEVRTAELTVKPLMTGHATTRFDLGLQLWEGQEGIFGSVAYDADLFDPTTIRRLVRHFALLLEAVVERPELRLGAVPQLAAAEHHQIVTEWRVGARVSPAAGTVSELFAARVERTPAAPAVVSGDRELSYRQLERRANHLARRLRALGIGPPASRGRSEIPVALFAERGPEVVIGLLGILKAGGVYLPLDPAAPRERLARQLRDAGAPVVLVGRTVADALPAVHGAEIVDLDAAAAGESSEAPVGLPDPDHLAYLIYTSGTTGEPKGVAVSHRQVVPVLSWFLDYYGFDERTRVLQTLSHCFDFGVRELLTTLLGGGTLFFLPPEEQADPACYLDAIARRQLNTVLATPSFFRELIAAGRPLPELEIVHLGAEALSRDLAEEIRKVVGARCRVYNGYGLTEAAVNNTVFRIAGVVRTPTVPIGRASAANQVSVLNPQGRPQPIGVPGELVVGGPGVARGYLKRPALTAERFVPDPNAHGRRLYRSGDLVRFLGDGNLEFLGRIDRQFKVRGFRIEPGEIEAALRELPAVREAVAAVHEDRPGDQRLVAYLVPGDESVPDPGELRHFLGTRMPESMVPATFVTLTALPLTATGKLDRAALPDPAAIEHVEYRGPRTPIEAKLIATWHRLLGVERVGIDDDFFVLGGHSLLATRLISQIRRELDCELPLRAVFEASTVAGLARRIATAVPGTSRPSIRRVPREKALPLSFAQERMWLLDQLTGGSAIYNLASAWRLIGPLEVPALAAAFSAVVGRHEALRTSFPAPAGQPVQMISPPAPAALPVIDLTALAAGDRDRESRRLATAEVARPFDLTRGPLLRTTLVRLAEQEAALLATMHHIVSDGWSIGILLRELTVLYQAATAGRRSPLAPLPIQYADFAAWQRRWLRGEVLDEQLAWWQAQLAGVEPLELPVDRPRPALQAFRGEQLDWRLDEEIVDALQTLGQRHGATLFMTLLTAFQILLARTTGQTDVVVGSPVANRNHPEIEDLIGFFVNTLAMRLRLAGDPELPQVLERTAGDALTAYGYQDLPFERLVEHLQPERDLSRNPIFQVVFALQNAPLPAVPMATGVEVRSLAAAMATTRFDLELLLWETGGGMLVGDLNWDADLFDRSTVQRLGEHFRTLLAGIAADAHRPLSALPLLGDGERRQLVDEWAGRQVPLPRPAVVHELFRKTAAARPHKLAVVCGEQQLSYRELNARANQLAHFLRRLGVGPEERVALCLERNPEQVIAILAVLKAGGVYVPLDPAYPPERRQWMLADSRARVLVTCNRWQPPPAEAPVRVLNLERDRHEIAECSTADPRPPVTADHLAYVMYTSGSTGTPKGVAVTHRSIVRLVRETDFADFGPRQVFLQLAPISFDASTFELWGPLLNGGRLAILPEEKPALRELGEAIARDRVTTLWLTAGLFHQMVEANLQGLRPLRQLLAGGDVLSAEHVGQVLRELPELRLINGYGPTENTTFTCCHTCRHSLPGEQELAGSVPIGRPIANTRIHLLDRYAGLAAPGAVGELAIGGAGLARAYLDRPALTATRFVPDPVGPERGARLYRTGDLARYRADGAVLFLGRIDAQVKVRGFRVEPGEIETWLRRHQEVAAAAVSALPDPSGSKRLVAWVVAAPGGAPSAETLAGYLGERLPAYMVPSFFVFLDRLPLTPNGKLDRNALPAPEEAAAAPTGTAGPRDHLEARLLRIWQQVLGIAAIGVDDDFFDLGGHSLLATRMVAEIRRELAVDLPLRMVFEEPTVAALAVCIREQRPAAAPPPIVPVPRDRELPLSFAQQRLWFIDRLVPESSFYNIAAAWKLIGPLHVPAVAASLSEIVCRHEALRTRFPAPAGEPAQAIDPPARVPLPVIDLRALPAAARAAETARISRRERRRPFRLDRGPLLRALLLRLAGEQTGLMITKHHIVSDGWSMGILEQELAALYEAARTATPSPLPELAVQYADFAVWQRDWLKDQVLAEQLEWWRRRLAGVPTLELPGDRPRPAVQAFRAGRSPIVIDPELTAACRRISRDRGATLYMMLLAVYQAVLGRSTGQRDVVVGSPVANRNHPGTERMIGFFVNALPMRAEITAETSFVALLEQVRENALEAFAHQDLPFEKLVDHLQIERDLSRNPIFQVVFALQNAEARTPAKGFAELSVQPLFDDARSTRFDLELHLWENPEVLDGMFLYDRDLFDPSTVDRLGERFRILLRGIAADPDRPLSHQQVLTAAEERRMLVDWNDVVADYDPEICLHRLFEAQAARHPDAVAVTTTAGVEWSYRELNRRANRLAHRLIALGVGPEVLTGVCLERSPEMIVALLAILKAGGAYVPIDPEYPRERIDFILADVAAPVVITRSWIAAELEADAVALCLDAAEPDGGDERNPPLHARSENTAYVIFTSGSTGRPKGVVEQHRPVSNLIEWINRTFEVGRGDRVLLVASLWFDLSVYDVFGLLAAGGSIHVAVDDEVRDPERLAGILDSGTITFWDSAPAALAQLVPFLPAAGQGSPRLRLAFVSGDWIPLTLQPAMTTAFPNLRVIGLGGATEATVWSNFHAIDEVRPEWAGIPYGRAIQNARYFVLDRRLRPCPLGTPGDLYIGGECLSLGYFRRPQLTAERYRPDPFSRRPGGVLYATGDRARWRPQGYVEFLGRLDNQVKIRGYRIELGEIEAALIEMAEVEHCVVLAREEVPGNKRLVAWLALGDRPAPDPDELREQLRQRLPSYMVPAVVVALASLPLTPNGKVDRKALAARPLREETAAPSGGFVAPKTPTEALLSWVWAQVLKRETVSTEDNFFEIGGDSILSIQVVARAREAGLKITPQQVFEYQTVVELAAAVAEAAPAPAPEPAGERFALVSLEPAERERLLAGLPPVADLVPLSPMQQEMLVHSLAFPQADLNVLQFLRTFDGGLELPLLRRAWQDLLRRHDVLRTAFRWQEVAEPLQLVFAEAEMPWRELDWRSLDAGEQRPAFRSLLREDRERGFDLAQPPLARLTVIRTAAERFALIWTVHHAVIDGWSLALLRKELFDLYAARVAGRDPAPVAVRPYRDYVAWLRRQDLDAAEAFWCRSLRDLRAPAPLWIDKLPANGERGDGFDRHTVELSAASSTALRAYARSRRLTPATLLQGAWALLLGRYAGDEDVIFGITVSGRPADLEGSATMVGVFINDLPVRIATPPEAPLGPWLRDLQDHLARVRQFEYTPQSKIRDWSDVPGNMPLYDTIVVFGNFPGEGAADAPEHEPETPPEPSEEPYFGARTSSRLTLISDPSPRLPLSLVFDRRFFERTTAMRMLHHLRTLAEGLLAGNDRRPLADLPLLTAAERHQLVTGPATVASDHRALQELLAARVAHRPGARKPRPLRLDPKTRIDLPDARGRPLPLGVPGEAWLSGGRMNRSVLGRLGARSEKLVPGPLGAAAGERFYRTGELARRLADGSVEWLGRLDRATRAGTRTLLPGVVEAALERRPEVREAAVVAVESRPGEVRPEACVIAARPQTPTAGRLHRDLEDRLPRHLLPAEWYVVPADAEVTLPRTETGEIDEQALFEMRAAGPSWGWLTQYTRDKLYQDSVEAQLARIWGEIFNLRQVDVDEDFFALGGSSVLAVSLTARIRDRLGVDLPLASLLAGSTVRQLAHVVREQAADLPWSPLVKIKPDGSRPPFFCVHAAGGNVVGFNDLVRQVEREQPFFGLQSVGLDGREQPYERIDEMAARYLDEIRTVDGDGPYALGGLSFGGYVAFEMACRLREQGRKVALLALFDAWSPLYHGRLVLAESTLDQEKILTILVNRTAGLYGSDFSISRDEIAAHPPERQIDHAVKQLYAAGVDPGIGPDQVRRLLKIHLSTVRATNTWIPRHYPGRVTIFRAVKPDLQLMEVNRHPGQGDPELHEGWRKLTDQPLEIIDVSGNHGTMLLEPHVRELAQHFNACLRRAWSRSQGAEPRPQEKLNG